MKKSILALSLFTASAITTLSGTVPIPINNYSFEANRSTSGTGAFGSGELRDLGLTSPTGWSVVATDNTAITDLAEIAFGWANLTPADPMSGPPQPQALCLLAGAVVGQVTDMPWSSLSVGDTLTLTIAAGDRNVNAPSGTPRWADESFFGLSQGLATRASATAGGSSSGWIGNVVDSLTVAEPPNLYKSGNMGDIVLSHTVTTTDVARSGNVGVFIASVGHRDNASNGTSVSSAQSFWDNVRLDLTSSRPAIYSFNASPNPIAGGATATLDWNVGEADTVTISHGIGEVWSAGSQAVSPSATTTYTLTASNSFGLATKSVTLTVIPPGPFRYYRFVPVYLRGGGNMIQLDEFQMLMSGNRIPAVSVSNPGGSNTPNAGEGAEKANDNQPAFTGDASTTKWLDANKQPLVYDFGVTTDVNGYRWATGNDAPERDPVSWRVEGSHDNVNWLVIDEQTYFDVTTDRNTYLADFAIAPFTTGPTVTFTVSPTAVPQGTSSTLSWNVVGADYISVDNGIGNVAATGTRTVTPSVTTTYTLTATNVSGVTTRSVTLTVIPPGPYRYYRFVPTKDRSGGTPPGQGGEDFQIAEFQLIFNGQWVPCPMSGVTCPGASRAVTDGEGAQKANDNRPIFVAAGQAGDTSQGDSKWNDSGMPPLQFDFGATQDVTGYRICTANDSESRDPVSWRVEGSHDGVNWMLIDQKVDYTTTTARNTYLEDFPIAPFGNGPRGTFTAAPGTIVVGSSSTLTWNFTNATGLTIDHGIGPVAAAGSTSVSPASTTTYTLTATNAAGATTKSVTVTVVLGLPVNYDFDDGTFQGWTDSSLGDTGTRGWSAINGWGNIQSGAHAIRSDYHDDAHPTMVLRSPEFTLNGSGDMSAWIAGGDGIGSLTGTQVSALPVNSADQGFMGIALRNKNNGTYVLSVRKSTGDGDSYEKLIFTAAQLSTLDQNATYTLDLVDACHGGWGWIAMDTVSIPGNLGSGPTNVPTVFAFTATPSQIMLGQSATLAWSVSNATSVSINNSVGTVAGTGSTSVSPTNTTTYTLTATGAGGTATATAKVTVFMGALPGRTYDSIEGDNYLNPIANLIAQTPSAIFEQVDDIAYEDNFVGNSELPGITGANDFCILWLGWFDVRVDGTGTYTFGTESDDGSVIYLDLNLDGDFADPGELIVNNNGVHPKFTETGSVDLQMDEVPIAIGFYQAGGGAAMYARFGKGDGLSYSSLAPINGLSGHFKATNSLPVPPSITFAANPAGILSGQSSTLSWTVLNATNVSIDSGIGSVSATGSQVVSPLATTTYTLTAAGVGGTRTASATVTIVTPGPYRYYRFAPTQLRNAGAANSVQIAEFAMLSGGTRLTGATASNPGGDSPGGESPAQANDNDLNSKWLDFTKFTPLVLDFGSTTPVDGYRWATANDADERDPVGWRVDGSHDGVNWVTLDERTGYATPTARSAWLSDFSLTDVPPFALSSIVVSPTQVTLTWQSVPSATYTIQASGNLHDPSAWTPVAQNIPSAGSVTTYSLPRDGAVKFYRVRGSR